MVDDKFRQRNKDDEQIALFHVKQLQSYDSFFQDENLPIGKL